MKNILILGGTGKLGKVLISYLLIKNNKLVVLARNPHKLDIKNSNLKIIKGNVTSSNDLYKALVGVDVVISTLGHGFRTKYPVLEKNLEKLIPLMEEKNIKRFIAVSGAALKTNEDENSLVLTITENILGLIDPYRLDDSKVQKKLLLKSKINWTVVRTPIHKNGKIAKISKVGYAQPNPWSRISRITVAKFIYDCIEENNWIRKSPIIY